MVQGQQLFDGLKQGQPEKIREIYKTILPRVIAWIVKNGGRKEQAEDIFQEVLETILLKIDKLDSTFDGLVLQIAKFKWYNYKRKSKREVRNDDQELLIIEKGFEASYIEKEVAYQKHKLFEKSFLQLSSLCQELLGLIRKGKKAEEIQETLAFNTKNTLYRRKAACIKRWSTLLKEDPAYKQWRDE